MRISQIVFCSLLFILQSFAQTDTTHLLENIKPRSIGPAGMSGRITAIDVVRDQPSHIFIGSASGGVWESTNGGVSWMPIFDDQPSLAIGALKIDPNNADILWVGTGEGNPRNSHNSGKGLYKSIDGGKSWKCLGFEDSKLIHRILIDPQNSQTVYIGVQGSAWGDSSERGVYRTKDGGDTWEKILDVNLSTGVGDMVMDPSNPNKLLVAMWDFRRTPWDFRSGGPGSGLYLSYDQGDHWKKMTSKEGLPEGELGRMGLAFSTNKPEIVYALIEAKKNGLYKSENGGEDWKLVASENIGNRPFYYAEIYVDPKNENRIFNLWSYVSKSEDGGKSFKTIMDYGNNIHPDHHAFYIHPDNTDFIINGNDGGLNISYDGGKTWTFSGNIPVGQFYHINYDTSFPYNVYGGMQDNGSWVGPHKVLRRGGIRNGDWQEIYFGDGFDVVPRLDNPRYGYAMSQGGNVVYYDQHTGSSTYIQPNNQDSVLLRFSWNAAIASDPFNPEGLYFGSQFLHYSDDLGASWQTISPDLTTNDSLKQKQSTSGGLTPDVTRAENHTTLLCIAPSVHDENVIWTGSDDGQLHVTQNKGETWKNVSEKLLGVNTGAWIPQIEIGSDIGEAFVVVNDYRRNDFSAYLYHTVNFGQSFKRIVNDDDVDGFVCTVVQDDIDPNLLFLGTDAGLYYSLDRGRSWTKWAGNFPNVQVRDLKIHPVTHDLIVGTFGRAIWIIDDISFLRNWNKTHSTKKLIHLFPVGKAHLTSRASYRGSRFFAQGEFIGENERTGVATLTYLYQPNEEDDNSPSNGKSKENGKEKQKMKVTISDEEGEAIRHFSFKPKKGLNRIYWPLNHDGVRGPSRKPQKDDEDAPGGRKVTPGRYQIAFCVQNNCDTTYVKVVADPRGALNQAYEDYDHRIDTMMVRCQGVLDRIGEVNEDLKKMKSSLESIEDSIKNNFVKRLDSLSEKTEKLIEEILGPKEPKGYVDNSQVVRSLLYRSRQFLSAGHGQLSPNGEFAFNHAKQALNQVIEKLNQLIDGEYASLKSEFLSLNPPLFNAPSKLKSID